MKTITKVDIPKGTPLTIGMLQGYLARAEAKDVNAEIRSIRVSFTGDLRSFEIVSRKE